jgi:hypothetical protein
VSSKIDSVWFPLGEAQMAILRKDDDPNLLWRKMSDEIAEAIRTKYRFLCGIIPTFWHFHCAYPHVR